MKFKATKYEIKNNLSGEAEITFKVSPENKWAVLQIPNDETLQNELVVEIKKYRNARTLNQNDLLWAIETKLAEKLKLPTQEVHKENIFNYSVKLGVVLMKKDVADRYIKTKKYARIEREEIKQGVPCAYVELFLGSSQLNTSEFSVLVDGVLQECKNVGINVDFEARELRGIINK